MNREGKLDETVQAINAIMNVEKMRVARVLGRRQALPGASTVENGGVDPPGADSRTGDAAAWSKGTINANGGANPARAAGVA